MELIGAVGEQFHIFLKIYTWLHNVLAYANGAASNLLKSVAGGHGVGPILMGMGNCAHIFTAGFIVRGLLNIAALAGSDVSSYG